MGSICTSACSTTANVLESPGAYEIALCSPKPNLAPPISLQQSPSTPSPSPTPSPAPVVAIPFRLASGLRGGKTTISPTSAEDCDFDGGRGLRVGSDSDSSSLVFRIEQAISHKDLSLARTPTRTLLTSLLSFLQFSPKKREFVQEIRGKDGIVKRIGEKYWRLRKKWEEDAEEEEEDEGEGEEADAESVDSILIRVAADLMTDHSERSCLHDGCAAVVLPEWMEKSDALNENGRKHEARRRAILGFAKELGVFIDEISMRSQELVELLFGSLIEPISSSTVESDESCCQDLVYEKTGLFRIHYECAADVVMLKKSWQSEELSPRNESRSGLLYAGEIFRNFRHGLGVCQFGGCLDGDGFYYVGEFRKGVPGGKGVYFRLIEELNESGDQEEIDMLWYEEGDLGGGDDGDDSEKVVAFHRAVFRNGDVFVGSLTSSFRPREGIYYLKGRNKSLMGAFCLKTKIFEGVVLDGECSVEIRSREQFQRLYARVSAENSKSEYEFAQGSILLKDGVECLVDDAPEVDEEDLSCCKQLPVYCLRSRRLEEETEDENRIDQDPYLLRLPCLILPDGQFCPPTARISEFDRVHDLVPLHHYDVSSKLFRRCVQLNLVGHVRHLMKIREEFSLDFSVNHYTKSRDKSGNRYAIAALAFGKTAMWEELLRHESVNPNCCSTSFGPETETSAPLLIMAIQDRRTDLRSLEILLHRKDLDVNLGEGTPYFRNPIQAAYQMLAERGDGMRQLIQLMHDRGANLFSLEPLLLSDREQLDGEVASREILEPTDWEKHVEELLEQIHVLRGGWTPCMHPRFPKYFRQIVWCLLLYSERISGLPTDIIGHILDFLPRTTEESLLVTPTGDEANLLKIVE